MNLGIISFNSGYLSPKIDARSDTEKYASGCRIIENMIPTIYGGAERRPGTKYIASTKNAGEAARLIAFIYSAEIAYLCEFGDEYIRFYYDGEQLDDGGAVEVASPYAIADIPELQIEQIGDVMWIVHPDYAPRKLSRTSATSFSLDKIVFEKGPFRVRNDLDAGDGVTLTPSVITGSGTLTASSATFEAGHVGSIWEITQPRVNTKVELTTNGTAQSSGLDTFGEFFFETRTPSGGWAWNGTIELQRNENGGGWETFRTWTSDGDKHVSLTATEESDNVQYRISAVITSGSVYGIITLNNPTQSGVVRIDSFTSSTVVDMTVLSDIASPSATTRWAEGAWSDVRGYPAAITSHADRIVYGGSTTDMQTLWLSETGNYEDFKEGVNDSDSFSVVLTSTNDIRWIGSLSVLAIGTSGDEYQLSSSDLYQPITPTNFSAKRQTNRGSSRIQPVRAGDALLFVDFVAKKIREASYSDVDEKLSTPDLNALSDDITLSGITSLAYQNNPEDIVWCTLADGTLLSMSYERDQNVIAWAKHPIDGVVNSVERIPGADEDEIWLSVTRTIDGSSVTYIEQMQPRYWGTDDSLAYFVDAGVIDTAGTTTVSGLDHLEGETVSVLVDGALQNDKVVASGEITLDDAGTTAIVGLPYTYKLKPMRLDIGTQDGTSKGSLKKITELVISFYQTLNARYGDGDNVYEIDWRSEEDYDSPPLLYSGDKVVVFDGGFTVDDPIIIQGSDPFPCTVRAIVARTEKTGR